MQRGKQAQLEYGTLPQRRSLVVFLAVTLSIEIPLIWAVLDVERFAANRIFSFTWQQNIYEVYPGLLAVRVFRVIQRPGWLDARVPVAWIPLNPILFVGSIVVPLLILHRIDRTRGRGAALHNPPMQRVRREKEKVFSGLRDPPGNWIAPAGSSRSGSGGNEAVEAFDVKVANRAIRERAGRNESEQPMRPRNG